MNRGLENPARDGTVSNGQICRQTHVHGNHLHQITVTERGLLLQSVEPDFDRRILGENDVFSMAEDVEINGVSHTVGSQAEPDRWNHHARNTPGQTKSRVAAENTAEGVCAVRLREGGAKTRGG